MPQLSGNGPSNGVMNTAVVEVCSDADQVLALSTCHKETRLWVVLHAVHLRRGVLDGDDRTLRFVSCQDKACVQQLAGVAAVVYSFTLRSAPL